METHGVELSVGLRAPSVLKPFRRNLSYRPWLTFKTEPSKRCTAAVS